MENKALFTLVYQILLQQEQVAIPGFGGFVVVYQPANIRKDVRKISGPRRKVSFNPSLKEDDGILTEALSREANLSKEKAAEKLSLFAQYLDQQLNQQKEIVFEGIGRLWIDEKGSQLFEAHDSAEINADTYGLAPELAPEVAKNAAVGKQKPMKPAAKTKAAKTGNRSKLLLYIGAPAVLVVAVLLFGYFQNWFSSAEEPLVLGTVEQDQSKPEMKQAETSISAPAEVAKEKPAKTNEAAASAADQIQEQYVAQGSCYIIAGSFAERSNALKKMEEMNGKGYQTEIHSAGNGYYRVSIGSYKTRDEALKVLQRQKQQMPDLWLWNKK